MLNNTKFLPFIFSFVAIITTVVYSIFLFLIFYLFIFRERGREGEREGEKHQWMVASNTPPTGDLACNPGLCPGFEPVTIFIIKI